jgi:hypothetical protein
LELDPRETDDGLELPVLGLRVTLGVEERLLDGRELLNVLRRRLR